MKNLNRKRNEASLSKKEILPKKGQISSSVLESSPDRLLNESAVMMLQSSFICHRPEALLPPKKARLHFLKRRGRTRLEK